MVEGNTETCCSEMTQNLLKNFQHLFTLVHLMFPYQYSITLTFSFFGNLEQLEVQSRLILFNALDILSILQNFWP